MNTPHHFLSARAKIGALFSIVMLAIAPLQPAFAGVGFGTSFNNGVISSDNVDADLGSAGMNCRTVRIAVKASDIAKGDDEPSSYNWTNINNQIAAINASTTKPNILVDVHWGVPCPVWMDDAAESQRPKAAQFATFFRKAVDHLYARGVRYFEIGNEPNLERQIAFSNPVDRANRYFAILKACYSNAKPAYPSAIFLGGVISSLPRTSNADDNAFFDRMWSYDHGGNDYGWEYMDALTIHTYLRRVQDDGTGDGIYVRPEDKYGSPNRGYLWPNLKNSESQVNYHSRKIWITETSYDTDLDGPHVTEQQQARWQVRAAITFRAMPNNRITRVLQFSAYDSLAATHDYGFRTAPGERKKPQWYAWTTMCSVLTDAVSSITVQQYACANSTLSTPAGNATHCLFRYATEDPKEYGYVMWWGPEGGSGTFTISGIPSGSTISKIVTQYGSSPGWGPGPTPNGAGTISVTDVGAAPVYIRIQAP